VNNNPISISRFNFSWNILVGWLIVWSEVLSVCRRGMSKPIISVDLDDVDLDEYYSGGVVSKHLEREG